jgi:hypothetical protein
MRIQLCMPLENTTNLKTTSFSNIFKRMEI